MAGEILATYSTGATLYATLHDATGQVRDVVTPEWEAWADASIGDYDIAMSEQGTASQMYAAAMPAGIAAGRYVYVVREQAGGSPAVSDSVVWWEAGYWSGSVWSYQSGDAFARLGAPAGASIAADVAAVDAVADAILVDTGTDGVVLATDAVSAAALAADAVDEIWDEVTDGSVTARQVLNAVLAFVGGITAGGGTGSIIFRRQDDVTAALTLTVDSDGDRSAVTLDLD